MSNFSILNFGACACPTPVKAKAAATNTISAKNVRLVMAGSLALEDVGGMNAVGAQWTKKTRPASFEGRLTSGGASMRSGSRTPLIVVCLVALAALAAPAAAQTDARSFIDTQGPMLVGPPLPPATLLEGFRAPIG